MASKATVTAAMAILVLYGIAASVPPAVADASFVESTCKNTDDSPQCVAVLSTDPRSVNATSVRELASIGLDIARANAVNISNYISAEADKRDGTPEFEALDFCVQIYGDALDALESVRDNFDKGQYSEAERNISGAEDVGGRCEQAFADHNVTSVVSDVDKRMTDWTKVAGDLIDLLYVVAKGKSSGSGRKRDV